MARPARMFSGRIGRTESRRRAIGCVPGASSVCVYNPVAEALEGCYECVGTPEGVVCDGPDPTGMITDFVEPRACADRLIECPPWPPPVITRKCCCYDELGILVSCLNRPVDEDCPEGCFAPGGALCGEIFDPPSDFCPPSSDCAICHEGHMPPFATAQINISACTGGCACSCCTEKALAAVEQINGEYLLIGDGACAWSGAFNYSALGCGGVPGCPSRGCGISGSFSIHYGLTNTIDGVVGTATLTVPFVGFWTLQQNFGAAPAGCGGVSGTCFPSLLPCGGGSCGPLWKDAALSIGF